MYFCIKQLMNDAWSLYEQVLVYYYKLSSQSFVFGLMQTT